MRRGVLLAAIVAVVIGCQQAPPPPPAPTKSPAVVLREEGDALAARGDYAGAAAKYETALASTPDDLALRFALGSAYSYLNRRPEAIVQLKQVVARATPDSQEYQLARQWLVSVGELREPPAAQAGAPATATQTPAPATPPGPQVGLSGTLEWRGITQGQRRVPVRLTLTGEDSETRNVKSARMARLAEKYSFANIPPGNYRLVVVGTEPRETPLWDVRVTVERDKPTVLNLSSSTASVSPDAFPGPE
ncbi:MAG TPA: tetratricopeptide repeat protein [Methylomirabilota bacterium]|nr:tetratricopeptide repeat protein [Methylomirabilota bacterium]